MDESIVPIGEQSSEFAPGVTLKKTPWFDRYTGTSVALVAAGLVRPEQLPGAPGMPKAGVTFYNGRRPAKGVPRVKDETYVNIVAVSRELFDVRRGLNAKEHAARLAEHDAERAASRAISAAAAEAERRARNERWLRARMGERTLQSMASSTQEYRDKEADSLRRFVDIAIGGLQPNTQSGYCLEADAVDQLIALRDQMLQVVAEACVVFDPVRHKGITQSCRAVVARDDAGFQNSLGRMIGDHG